MLPSGWGAKSLAAGWPYEDYSDCIRCQGKKLWKPSIYAVFARFCKLSRTPFSPLHATPDWLKPRKNGRLLLRESYAAAPRFAKILFRLTSLPPLLAPGYSLRHRHAASRKKTAGFGNPAVHFRVLARLANSPCHTAAISAGSRDCCRKRSRWRSWFRLSSEESTP